MDEHTIGVLEFDKVLGMLARECSFSVSRELAGRVRPSGEFRGVAELQTETAEMTALDQGGIEVPTAGCTDIRPSLEAASVGQTLEISDLVDVARTLQSAFRARQVIERVYDRVPGLWGIALDIADFRPEVAAADEAINIRGEIVDGASPQLAVARKELRQARDRLEQRAQAALNDAVRRGIAQEPILTERSGRKVIPIKADFRGQMPGIVHDVSSSGATVFLEPMSVVDAGNDVRELELAEQREIRRILEGLTALFGERRDDAHTTLMALARLYLIRAKVRLGRRLRCHLPLPGDGTSWLSEHGETRLCRARHPLLTGDVVPLDVDIGDQFPGLLITGPNTGGKTVALKTVGLLTLMVQAGLPVPCDEESRFIVFRRVEADIGDEQSIEQSLSTFSSHMRNIRRILENAAPGTLALLDELGAGTDPTEGFALSRAILERLLERGCTVMATTHHGELKTFAHEHPLLRNASVDFDLESLSPTYHLTIGLPGQSNAIAIARRLGIEDEVLRNASATVAPGHAEIEQLLNEIRSQRSAANDARRAADEAQREAERLRIALSRERETLAAERAGILFDARREAEELVARARRELNRARERLAPVEDVETALRDIERHAADVRAAEPAPAAPPALRPSDEPVHPGDIIRVRDIPQPGEVLSDVGEDGRLEAQFGALRMKISVDRIESVERHVEPERQRATVPEGPAGPQEIDLRGQRAEEALQHCDEYLDRAFRDGLPYVRIIHGRGTGALRQAVREELARHPLVRRYETAPPNEGGDGVTVAILAS